MARRPQARVVRHDALILDATVELAAQRGWPGVLFPRVIESTGLSERPLRDRYRDRFGLAQQVWRQRLEDPVLSAMREVMEVIPGLGGKITGPALAEVLEPFCCPDEQMSAAAEMIIVARYQPPVCTAVSGSLGAALAAWTNPDGAGMTKTLAARRAYTAALALGLLTYSRLTHGDMPDLHGICARLAKGLSTDVKPVRLPAEKLDRFVPDSLSDARDSAWDHLLKTMVEAVGTFGYDAATFDVITEMAEVSRGMIQGYFPTKAMFFSDVAQRIITTTGMMQPVAGEAERAQWGSSVGGALELREMMRPEHQGVRTVVLEQVRLGWHRDEAYAQVVEHMVAAARPDRTGVNGEAWQCVDQALLWGAGLLAELHPASWELPYAVVTEALSG